MLKLWGIAGPKSAQMCSKMGGHGEPRNSKNLPWWAVEFGKRRRGIWQNLLRKTVVPTYITYVHHNVTEQLRSRKDNTNQTLCVWRCFLTFDFCAKARPQTIHWNGFSPVWERVCCCRSKFFVNDLSQYWQCSTRGAVEVLLASITDGFTRRWGRLTTLLLAIVVMDSSPRAANATKHQPISSTNAIGILLLIANSINTTIRRLS